jgi:glycosyltransferase involved in cell wall biosynthesis
MKKRLRVAIVSPPFGQTGGPELTSVQLADALVDKGLDVTLFAPADFVTKAKLEPTMERSLWKMSDLSKMSTFEKRNLIISSQVKIISLQDNFDIIHISSQRYGYAVAKNIHKPKIITLHNRMKKRDYAFLKKTGIATIALTKKYKELIGANAFVYPGIPIKETTPSFKKGSGLITIGRITDQKGIHIAVKIAHEAKKKLTIVGKIGKSQERQDYFKKYIRPYLKRSSLIIVEEISNKNLLKLIAKSEALLFPITRPETFGRVSIEALACGTPVIGTKTDPLPEILKNKEVSFLSNDMKELIFAAKNTDMFDRKECRNYAEKYFTSSLMAEEYIKLYKKLIAKQALDKKR